MIEQAGVVLRADAQTAVVQPLRQNGGCSSCGASGACGTSLLDRILGRRPTQIEVANTLDVSVGDNVVIGIAEAALLKTATAAYLGPLLGLLVGALLGQQLPFADGAAELASLAGAVLGFALALRLVAVYGRTLAADPNTRPVLLRRARSAPVSVSLA
jgi:sigma-E factor negative regulatory protein RseC